MPMCIQGKMPKAIGIRLIVTTLFMVFCVTYTIWEGPRLNNVEC